MSKEFNIGDKAKEYIYTIIGECIGCIEIEIAQTISGEKIKMVTDSHGGVGFISNGATAKLHGFEHNDDHCTQPDDRKYRGMSDKCSSCWMNKKAVTVAITED